MDDDDGDLDFLKADNNKKINYEDDDDLFVSKNK